MNANLILVLLASGGTAALIGAAFLFGFNRSSAIADVAAAKHFLYLYAPEIMPNHVMLSSDQANALITTQDNRVFLIAMLGDGVVTRELKARDMSAFHDGIVMIDVQDFGFPLRPFKTEKSAVQPFLDAFNKGQIQ
jgi:hypothetical protein